MTRSFGDQVACKAGVHALPEIRQFVINPDDKVVVIASDGVWEFMTNVLVLQIIEPFIEDKNAEGAAEALIRQAFHAWQSREKNIDDITCVILFLDASAD
jgi:serine/threonine protein phosphatase PrpC